ncbi:hypothetical protein LBW59_24180 [Ralstonia solanacearum]|uniref:Uncharacterized protein n=1 Tax=Ralstonia solanacearum TaxID=305 RepID=A0AAW5ZW63_RALSL|nr:hypothetical protein [Ralstonia solanacearum]MDB0573848.1 hypothetical protein [Ralstonia solanacearum]
MTEGINWAAPIEPGKTMLGLSIGMRVESVKKMLRVSGESSCEVIKFQNSPRMLVDCSKDGVILFRAADVVNAVYAWQDVFARLIFDQGILRSIIVLTHIGDDAHQYKGKMFDRFGLGSRVADLLEYGPVEYDEADEVFFSLSLKGLEVAGTSSCDLSTDPEQTATFIRVFQSESYVA